MKKNCLFIHAQETDKVTFFSSISNFLKEEEIKTTHLTFSRLDKKVYKQLGITNTRFLPKILKDFPPHLNEVNANKYDLDKLLYFTLKFNDLNGFTYNKEELYKNASRYINYLNELYSQEAFDLIVIWNDTFMYDSIAKQFASENGINTLIFEDGIFRPNTITIDPKGVNYGNSVPQDPQYYRQLNLEKIVDETKSEIYQIEKPTNIKKFYIYERILDSFHTWLIKDQLNLNIIFETIPHKLSRVVKKIVNKKNKTKDIKLPEEYIFVPFQVHDDSQVILNSPQIENMEELVKVINHELKLYNKLFNKQLVAVFKEHPADYGRVDYSDIYNLYKKERHLLFLKEGDTKKIVENCTLVITINSTVGIEALQSYKPVITLGNAYYNIKGVCNYCSNHRDLHNNINSVSIDKDLVDRFLNYLRYIYQIDGNWRKGQFNYSKFRKKLESLR
ncbi:capsular polysaccharide export protein, LipB/KpsS family [Metabacillus halosaccharovorans]|uniref:Capsular biosynthesis protein n=1 Tax=Metabacillus halosaccharovorans TaxID=930124 RepID=A0ABT3DC19_9BACI|nr:hypothetical protein [Metabacillus halosaccharovorans]MCV9884492.1 hypothetical protein [Metabacillus halosaccharovorans]